MIRFGIQVTELPSVGYKLYHPSSYPQVRYGRDDMTTLEALETERVIRTRFVGDPDKHYKVIVT